MKVNDGEKSKNLYNQCMKIKFIFFIFILFPLPTSAYSLVTKTVDGHRVRIFHIGVGDAYKVTAVASNTGTTLKSLVKG